MDDMNMRQKPKAINLTRVIILAVLVNIADGLLQVISIDGPDDQLGAGS